MVLSLVINRWSCNDPGSVEESEVSVLCFVSWRARLVVEIVRCASD
jgi:hypothetical protein